MALPGTIIIRIGHPAYSLRSLNRLRYCFSKREAVEELRSRGMKRNDARTLVNSVTAKPDGYAIAGEAFNLYEPIEIGNYTTQRPITAQWAYEARVAKPLKDLK